MRRWIVSGVGFFLFAQMAWAHRIDEYLQATMLTLQAGRLQASMRLIPGILVAPVVIAAIDSNGDGVFSADEQKAYAERVLRELSVTLDGKVVGAKLVSWSVPQPGQLRDGLGEIHVEYSVDLPAGGRDRKLVIANHHLNAGSVYLVNVVVPEGRDLRVVGQHRNPSQTVYELDYEQASGVGGGSYVSKFRVWMRGLELSSLFHLGMRHIAEGTDHLLFLLTLLLPAPLIAVAGRWGPPAPVRASLLRILGIVTAFTVGHSLTLTLAAFGAVHVPSRPVEILIAVSILVSALHALRPLVPGKEALIAGFFGLIHGLAFAATLDRLGLGRWDRLAGILSFNLGIEAMQMLVVVAVLPSLMLMSRTPAYSVLRVGGALFAVVASVGWIVERVFHVESRVDLVVSAIARESLWIAVGLLVVSVVCRLGFGPRAPIIVERDEGSSVS